MTRVIIAVTNETTAGSFLPPIIRALKPLFSDLLVVSGDGHGLKSLSHDESVKTYALQMDRDISFASDMAALSGAVRIIREFDPDVIMVATPKASLIFSIAGRLTNVTQVIVMSWGLRFESLNGVKKALVYASESLGYRLAHEVLANSHSLARRLITSRMASEHKVTVLGTGSSHGVDLVRFRPRPHKSTDRIVIGFIGRIRRDKGVSELLLAYREAARSHPSMHLRLAGTIEDDDLATEIDRLEATGAATYVGHVADTSYEYDHIDVLCLPTWREGFPNVCLEAAACGIPVITTDATGAYDAVVDGTTGLRVQRRNIPALTRALETLAADPDLRHAMGREGRRWVETNFGSDQVCDRLAGFVSACTARRTASRFSRRPKAAPSSVTKDR